MSFEKNHESYDGLINKLVQGPYYLEIAPNCESDVDPLQQKLISII